MRWNSDMGTIADDTIIDELRQQKKNSYWKTMS
jgi:hypothetical protein